MQNYTYTITVMRITVITYNKHIYKAYSQVKIVHLRSNTPFNSSKWFFFSK